MKWAVQNLFSDCQRKMQPMPAVWISRHATHWLWMACPSARPRAWSRNRRGPLRRLRASVLRRSEWRPSLQNMKPSWKPGKIKDGGIENDDGREEVRRSEEIKVFETDQVSAKVGRRSFVQHLPASFQLLAFHNNGIVNLVDVCGGTRTRSVAIALIPSHGSRTRARCKGGANAPSPASTYVDFQRSRGIETGTGALRGSRTARCTSATSG